LQLSFKLRQIRLRHTLGAASQAINPEIAFFCYLAFDSTRTKANIMRKIV
jgi:hypothetical protein